MTSVEDVVANAEWLAHRYDETTDAIHFAHVTRGQRSIVTFLTDQYLPSGLETKIVPRTSAVGAMKPTTPIHFIFHSAFCCSTLLARAFELPGVSSSLKEPVILNDITGWRHRGRGRPSDIARVLDQSLRLLGRPFAEGEAVIVKPSNVTHGLVRGMMTMRPNARALLLYAPLETYLKSIAKKGIDGRLWVRRLLINLIRDGFVDLGIDPDQYLSLTDLQAAVVGWLAQHDLFMRLTKEFPSRFVTLDCDTLLTRPERTIIALAQFYDLIIPDDAAQHIIRSELSKNSKSGQPINAETRAKEYDYAYQLHKDEIDKVIAWGRVVAERVEISMTLPAALI